jgi:hypothetical protein
MNTKLISFRVADPRDALTDNLILLRQMIERETGLPLQCVSLNAAALLDDFCQAIGLTDAQLQRILGNSYEPICGESPIIIASQIFDAP